MSKKIKMDKELKVVLKRIDIEKYQKEKPCDDCSSSSSCEVLVMNYDDDDDDDDNLIFDVNAEMPALIPKKEDIHRDINLEYNGVQEIGGTNREVKLEDDELCDVDTKQNILVKFEENIDDTEQGKSKNRKSNAVKKKLVCEECGFRAEKKHYLQAHIRQAHQNKKDVPKEFPCEHCVFTTKWKHNLLQHMARFHMDEVQTAGSSKSHKKKSCYDVQSIKLMDHCTLDKNNMYQCNYCSYTTTGKNLIMQHAAVHTVNKSEVFQCPDCPKKFFKSALQDHHRKEHNPEGIFHCTKCSYKTKWTNNLRRHHIQNKGNDKCKPVQKRKPRKRVEDEPIEVDGATCEESGEDSE